MLIPTLITKMKRCKNNLILMLYLLVQIGFYTYLQMKFEFFFLPEFCYIITSILNILITYSVIHSNTSKTNVFFIITLVLLSFIFTFLMFEESHLLMTAYVLILFAAFFLFRSVLSLIRYENHFPSILTQLLVLFISLIIILTNGNSAFITALIIFINYLSVFFICVWNYFKIKKTKYIEKTIRLLFVSSFFAFAPYLFLTFLPKFVLQNNHFFWGTDISLYFILVLPITYTLITTKLQAYDFGLNLFSSLIGLIGFILIINATLYEVTNCSISNIYIFDNIFLAILVVYDLIYSLNFEKRQKRLHKIIGGFENEKTEILSNLESNRQLDNFLDIITNILNTSLPCSGIMIMRLSKYQRLDYLIRTGEMIEALIPIEQIQHMNHTDPLLIQSNKNQLLVEFLGKFNKKNTYLIISLDNSSTLNINILNLFKSIAKSISDLFFKYFLITDYQKQNSILNYSTLERIAYFKRMDVAEKEKKELSTYLHDEILQTLAGIKNLIFTLDGSNKTKDLISSTIEDISDSLRDEVIDLYPSFVEILPFKTCILNLVNKLNIYFEKSINLDICVKNSDMLTQKEKYRLYRITKELITNSFKHSNASIIIVNLNVHHNLINLSVSDNGINANEKLEISEMIIIDHLGLLSIKQEVSLMGGDFKISNENKKFNVIINYPRIHFYT